MNKKSARRRLAPKSAGILEDKGVLCLFSKTEATRSNLYFLPLTKGPAPQREPVLLLFYVFALLPATDSQVTPISIIIAPVNCHMPST